MDEGSDRRVPSLTMDELHGLLHADTPNEVAQWIDGFFGSTSRLYAVDHEFGHLMPLDADLATCSALPLVGDQRAAVLRAERYDDGVVTWIPLVERQQVVFVVAVPAGSVTIESDDMPKVLGEVFGGHRRRFEDYERRRRRADMTVAAELQWDLMPLRADVLGSYSVAGVLEPAYEVAGDLFEYALFDGAVWAYSFDGMGHGMEATLASVQVLAAVRNARRQGATLAEQMQRASAQLWEQYSGDRFVTGAACRIDPSGAVDVVNAGHEPIRIVAAGAVTRLDLDVDVPLGVAEAPVYRTQRAAELAPGDGFVMFSDGISSQRSDGDDFGDDRLDDALARCWTDIPLQTGHSVVRELLDFIATGRVDDDVTAVVVRRIDEAGSERQ